MNGHAAHVTPQGWGDYLLTQHPLLTSLLIVCIIIVVYFLVRREGGLPGRGRAALFLLFGVMCCDIGLTGFYNPAFLPDRAALSLPECVGLTAGGIALLKLSWDAYRARKPIRWERLLFWKDAGDRF